MKEEKPLVSVVIPAYNAEAFIIAALKSVEVQTYPNLEILVVDDGSTDATAALIQEEAKNDPRIRYFYQKNKRMASARNTALRHARGEYVAFLDADNLFSPTKIERQLSFLENNADCDVCYGKIFHFYNDDPGCLYQSKNGFVFNGGDFFKFLLHHNFINVLAVLVRRKVLDDAAFPEGWYGCDDHFFWLNLALRGARFHFLDDVSGLLRLHSRNDSFKKEHVVRTAVNALSLLDFVEANLSQEDKKRYSFDLSLLRRQWKIRFFIGKLMDNFLFSWILMPLFLKRRKKAYTFVGTKKEIGV